LILGWGNVKSRLAVTYIIFNLGVGLLINEDFATSCILEVSEGDHVLKLSNLVLASKDDVLHCMSSNVSEV